VTAQSDGDVTVTVLSDTAIRIVGACWLCGGTSGAVDRVYMFSSGDGGASAFGAGVYLGSTPTTSGISPDGIVLPNGVFVSPAEGDGIIARPGSADGTKVDPVTGFLFVYSPSVVQVPGQNMLVYAVNDLGVIKYATYFGPGLTASNIMFPGNWTGNQTLAGAEADNGETRLNAGPSGVWLTYQQRVPGDDHLGLRKLESGTFGAPRYLESPSDVDSGIGYPSSAQDGSGRVHVVWRSLYDTKRLRYTRSDATGATFGEPLNIAQGEFFLEPEVAAGPDGNGWAVWTDIGTSPVRVIRIEPYPEPGPTPVPAPAPAPVPTPTGPTGPGAPVLKTVSVPGASISFGVPTGCVQPGSTFRVTLSWKRKKRKGNLFVKVTRADFYIGTKVVRKDKKAPFVQTLRVTASAKRGSTISLRARAFIKVKRGKAPKKSVKATIKVCA
jgi:hypothetical protein